MQMGALIGTMMVANVFMVIIPNQKKVVADLIAGRAPDPKLGQQAKQRSMHNNYLTLPVLFVMISNHYPLAFASRFNWLILALVLVVGAIIRHFYNERHAGPAEPLVGLVGRDRRHGADRLAQHRRRPRARAPRPRRGEVDLAEVENIVLSRCSMCHTAEPYWAGHAGAAQGRGAGYDGADPPARVRHPAAGGARPTPCRPATSPRSRRRSASCWPPGSPPARRSSEGRDATEALRGQLLSFVDDPQTVGAAASHRHVEDGVVLIEDGRIAAVGEAQELLPRCAPARRSSIGPTA